MERNDFIEQIVGGFFAIIAVGAAIAELFINGLSTANAVACIKDVFGTLAIVVLFFAVMKDRIPKIKFEEKLSHAIDEWVKENSNMIIRKAENDNETSYSLDMKTNVADFYNKENHKDTGLFVRIPTINRVNYLKKVSIDFFMNKGTFFVDIPQAELTADSYKKLGERFCGLVKEKNEIVESATTEATNKNAVIHIVLKKAVKNKKDISEFIDVINTMYTAYLVSARIKNK